MVESLFNLVRDEFFSVRIITRYDEFQIRDFQKSIYAHYLAMDASVQLLQNRHLSATTILARVALQLNSMITASQESRCESFSEFVEIFLPRVQNVLSTFIQSCDLHDPDTYLDLNRYTLWSDFDILDRNQGGFLFTLESTKSHVIRALRSTGVVRPNRYRLICAKVTALVTECQRCDDLIHSFATATFQCLLLFDLVRSDLKRMLTYLERPRARPVRVSIGRTEFERGLKDIVRTMYRRRFRWVSPEEKISHHYCNPSVYYRS